MEADATTVPRLRTRGQHAELLYLDLAIGEISVKSDSDSTK